MTRKLCSLVLIICLAAASTACGLFSTDLGLKHLKEKYPGYSFEFKGYADDIAFYTVEGFDDSVVVRAVGDGEFYDNFLYVRYKDQILDSQVDIMTEICSRLGVDDFNIATYGYNGWMRDGVLTSTPDVSEQNAKDYNTDDLPFEEFMASKDSNNELIGVICLEDVSAIDRDAVAAIISDVLEESGCVYSLVRIDFTDNLDEFESTFDSRWVVYDYQLMLLGQTDENGQLIDYSWKEN